MIWLWIGFIALIMALLALDLGVFHRKTHVIGMREALSWSALWATLAVCFTVFVYFGYERHWLGLGLAPDAVDGVVNDGRLAAVKYLTGYIIELSLSMDNVFVIALIFAFFKVPPQFQHRLLFWGIIGAQVMRGLMIGAGAVLIARFHWILYVFGAFLVLTGIRMLYVNEPKELHENWVIKLARRLMPVTHEYHGMHFTHRGLDGRLMLTPMALALIMVESTDVLFAVDSIPAIFAITSDPFLVFTSNVFAILGLRSLYFALAGLIARFRYLEPALAMVLMLVGIKMLAADFVKDILGPNANLMLLAVVFAILAGGVIVSLARPVKDGERERSAPPS